MNIANLILLSMFLTSNKTCNTAKPLAPASVELYFQMIENEISDPKGQENIIFTMMMNGDYCIVLL